MMQYKILEKFNVLLKEEFDEMLLKDISSKMNKITFDDLINYGVSSPELEIEISVSNPYYPPDDGDYGFEYFGVKDVKYSFKYDKSLDKKTSGMFVKNFKEFVQKQIDERSEILKRSIEEARKDKYAEEDLVGTIIYYLACEFTDSEDEMNDLALEVGPFIEQKALEDVSKMLY